MKNVSRILTTVLVVASSSFVACTSDNSTSPSNSAQATDPANGKTISELVLTGDDRTTLEDGKTTQLTATLHYADGTTRDITRDGALWNTNDASNATISSEGLVSAVSTGIVEISVSYNGITEKDTIVITG